MNTKTTIRRYFANYGFTLLELVAAGVVFAIMLTFTLSLLNNTSKIVNQTTRQMDSTDGLRTAMDAIVRDLQNMVRTQGYTLMGQPDASWNPPQYDVNASGLDTLTFLCAGRPSSYVATNSLNPNKNYMRFQEISYQVSTNTNANTLVRLQTWPLGKGKLDPLTDATYLKVTNAIDQILDVVSNQVLYMKVLYMWKDGSVTTRIPADKDLGNPTYYPTTTAYPAGSVDLTKLNALAIALVGIDQKSLTALGKSSTFGFKNLASNLFIFDYTTNATNANTNTNGVLPLAVWKDFETNAFLNTNSTNGVRWETYHLISEVESALCKELSPSTK